MLILAESLSMAKHTCPWASGVAFYGAANPHQLLLGPRGLLSMVAILAEQFQELLLSGLVGSL